MGAEFGRTLLLMAVSAVLAAAVGVSVVPVALGSALLMWPGFPVVILAGSVLQERVPVGCW